MFRYVIVNNQHRFRPILQQRNQQDAGQREEFSEQQSEERAIDSYLVKDYMIKEIVTMDRDGTAEEAAKIMAEDELGQGYVLVLEKGRQIGILTEKDIVIKILAAGMTRKTKFDDIMTSPLITIDPDEDLVNAARTLIGKKKVLYLLHHFRRYHDHGVFLTVS